MGRTRVISSAAYEAIRPARISSLGMICAVTVFTGFLFLHAPLTAFCDEVVRRIGFTTYERTVAASVLLAAIAIGAALYHRRRASPSPTTWVYLVALLAAAALAQPTLILINIEYIHLPQYALLAVLLARAGVRPEAAWLGATGLGLVDEAYQFLFLRVGRPERLDWNDITFNAMGAALGVVGLLHLAMTATRPLRHSRRTILTILTPLVAIALVVAPPDFTPFYSVTPAGLRSHELKASEGLILVGALWVAVHELVRRLSKSGAPTPSVGSAVATTL